MPPSKRLSVLNLPLRLTPLLLKLKTGKTLMYVVTGPLLIPQAFT